MEPPDDLTPLDPPDPAWAERMAERWAELNAMYEDSLSVLLTELEESIEGTEVKPPWLPEAGPVEEAALPLRSPEAKAASVPDEEPAAPPALPYYTDTLLPVRRLTAPPPNLARGGSGAGIRNAPTQREERYCPVERDWVPEDLCEECEYYEPDSEESQGCSYYREEQEPE